MGYRDAYTGIHIKDTWIGFSMRKIAKQHHFYGLLDHGLPEMVNYCSQAA